MRFVKPECLGLFFLVLQAGAGSAAQLVAGRPFPLSNGVAPALLRVEVYRAQSDGLIDVAVSFAEPRTAGSATAEELFEFGELCLRYGAEIMKEAVPAVEHNRLRVFAPLYRSAIADSAGQYKERGFAFDVHESQCTLSSPFPAAAKDEVLRRANEPISQ
jgi:hypothetical protein